MTATEMRYEFRIVYESIASMNAPAYTAREISVLLTEAEEEIVIETADSRLDGDERARMILQKLLTPYSNPTVSADTELFASNAYSVALPADFFYPFVEFINDAAFKPVDFNSYYNTINNPFAQPYEDLYWRLFQNNKLLLVSYTGSVLSSSQLKGLYVKKPLPIIVENLGSNSIDGRSVYTDCELHPIVHREIVYRAAKKAYAAVKDQIGYQIQNTEENQN